jgi:hypothetical protein
LLLSCNKMIVIKMDEVIVIVVKMNRVIVIVIKMNRVKEERE